MAERKIEEYYLYYTPKGAGRVAFKLAGESKPAWTPPLKPEEFSALAILLAQRRIAWDDEKGYFMSYDDDYEAAYRNPRIS